MNKSPLKPPANRQFSCLQTLREMIPDQSVVNSYLFYDGAIELALAKSNRFVVARTNKYVIYEFWKCLLYDPERIAEFAEYLFPMQNRRMFEVYQEKFAHFKGPFIRAATFFVLNQCSDSGMISSGHLANSDGDPLRQSYLKKFSPRNFNVKFDSETDFIESLADAGEDEYILLPIGRYSPNLFEEGKPIGLEETTVYHKKVKEFFESTDKKMILLYYFSPRILKWYQKYNLKMINEWGLETTDQTKCKEVVIANF